ncbi:MAG: hypothetical protein U5R30_20065 [Deltaproteobacteria bacterium]|nr:hypothetical protein [Deltaproteobacteria bacterium]
MKTVKSRQKGNEKNRDQKKGGQSIYLERQGEHIQVSKGGGVNLWVEHFKNSVNHPQQASKPYDQAGGRFHEDKLTPKKKRHEAPVQYQDYRKEKVSHDAPDS